MSAFHRDIISITFYGENIEEVNFTVIVNQFFPNIVIWPAALGKRCVSINQPQDQGSTNMDIYHWIGTETSVYQ